MTKPIGLETYSAAPKSLEALQKTARGEQDLYGGEFREAVKALKIALNRALAGDYERVYSGGTSELVWNHMPVAAEEFGLTPKEYPLVVTELRRLPKAVAKTSPKTDATKRILEIQRSWLPVIELIDQVKPRVLNGKRPKPSKAKFTPKAASEKSLVLFERELRKVSESRRLGILRHYRDYYVKLAETYKERTDGTTSPMRFFKDAPREGAVVKKMLKQQVSSVYELDPNYRTIALKIAEETVDRILQRFVDKNLSKVAPILDAKDSDLLRVKTDQGFHFDDSNDMYLEFTDGTRFGVRNNIVSKWSRRVGVYAQFPTTFHDVVFPNGTAVKKLSEKDMHHWATWPND